MRIAYLCADKHIPLYGAKGASIHVQEVVRAFAELENRVTVFAARRGEAAVELDASVVEIAAPADGLSNGALGDADRVREKELRALAVSDAIAAQVAAEHEREPFDLVYERYSLFSTAGVQVARATGLPCVVEVNSPLVLEQQRYRRLLHVEGAQRVERKVFCNADVLLTVSAEVREYALGKGARAARTHVVPNAVDTKRFHPQVRPTPIAAAEGRFVVGFAGGLRPWHGIEVLMDAFRSLAHQREDAHLLVAGDGPLRGWLEGYVRGARLDERVTVLGWVANEDMPTAIAAMDVAVAPYPDLDGFYFSPLKLAEYMAVGKPVVASGIGQLAESIDHGMNGLLVPAGDAEALAHALCRLRDDAPMRAALGRRAASTAATHTWRDSVQRVLALAAPLVAAA